MVERKNQIVVIDMPRDQLCVYRWVNNDIEDYTKQRKKLGHTVVLEGPTYKGKKIGNIIPKFSQKTCVSTVCDVLGIKPRFCYTPGQLYNTLVKKYGYKEKK